MMKLGLTAVASILISVPTIAASPAANPVRTYLVDPAVLIQGRDAYRRGEPGILPAVKRLLRDAEKALALKPPSVMEKDQLPPSGDRHDYMSMGKYWWPDSSKPHGLPYIRRDGEVNPEAGRTADAENLSKLIKAASTLSLGYFYSGEEKYAQHATRLLRTWFIDSTTRMNPHLAYAQAVPGRNEGRGSGIIDAHQFPELIDGIGLLAESRSWTRSDQQGLEAWFTAYLKWLRESEHGRREAAAKNNHGTWYDVQLCAAALLVGDTALAASTLGKAQKQRIASQIEPDGSQPAELQRTKSWDYSFFNLTAFFRLASLGERVGVDLWRYRTPDGRSIKRAVDWLVPYVAGDALWAHQQITDPKWTGIGPLLLQAAQVWGENRYRDVALRIEGFNASTDRSVLFLGNW